MRRTFFALDLEEPFLRDTLALMTELRGELGGPVRWVGSHTLHVTLRFLGDTEEARLPGLVELAASLDARIAAPLVVGSTSLIAFPNPRRAHVLALHLGDDGSLVSLAARVEEGVIALGFAAEQRAFRPHLTLARLREPTDLRSVFAKHAVVAAHGRLIALTLYDSVLGQQGGPVHSPLARHVLGGKK